jgi:AsmA protein
VAGSAQGQVSLDGAGDTPADIMRHLHGRANITVRQGEIIGVSLGDVMRRTERRPLSASFDWRGGRTPFEQAQLNLTVTDGIAEITEGGLTAASLRAVLQGRISFADRLVSLRANVEPTGAGASAPGPGMVFDIGGPWDDVAVTPDVRALIERSGAAQPLLTPSSRSDASRAGQAPTVAQ